MNRVGMKVGQAALGRSSENQIVLIQVSFLGLLLKQLFRSISRALGEYIILELQYKISLQSLDSITILQPVEGPNLIANALPKITVTCCKSLAGKCLRTREGHTCVDRWISRPS